MYIITKEGNTKDVSLLIRMATHTRDFSRELVAKIVSIQRNLYVEIGKTYPILLELLETPKAN